ncbi:hypothetical protein [Luteibaculum oceani]|uniref:Septum formation inhibitor Maf n=1 Tax=Luteibaculum oceani TaxID=1294296 RepID=A0A5C6V1I0_9FLAO|nr:hypothetical protein [Luteibaculum oceani]TXC78521.1 hypothetical protein FRX97_07320 [Luteibaculum oceani]
MRTFVIFLSLLFLVGCNSNSLRVYQPQTQASPGFPKFWYQGKAELAYYEGKQSRYGYQRDARAILITVSEPFDSRVQVKSDAEDGNDYPVLKCNLVNRFNTGVYDYSVMTSSFTPINTEQRFPVAKITSSVQDWCGQTFTQANRSSGKMDLSLFSYFEKEQQGRFFIEADLFWDEVFALLRMNPDILPTGDVTLALGLDQYRYLHRGFFTETVFAEWIRKDKEATYSLKSENFHFTWRIEDKAPYPILGWSIDYLQDGKVLENRSSAFELQSAKWLEYWNKNSPEFEELRIQMGLRFFEN